MKKSLVEGSSVSSAKSAWGQWASFSLGIGKLQGYSGKAPTLKQPFIAGSKEEADWMSVATKVFEGGVGLLGAYEEEQEKEVDKYLNNHSQEEYIEAIKSKGLPFQNDPIAMKVFKGKYANIYSGMAYSEFKERVLNGDFDGMSEAQMDAELFRHMRDAKERIARDTNGEFSGKAFDEAFYLDSPKQRALMMATLTKRNRDIKVQQDQIATKALLQTSLDSGVVKDADTALTALEGVYATTGRQYTPKEWVSFINDYLADIANSPDGINTLKGLKGKDIPHLDGLKFDDDDLDVHISNAVKHKAETDASAWYSLEQQVADLETKGDMLGLKNGLALANKKYSNEQNPESTLFNDAILRLKKKKQAVVAGNIAYARGQEAKILKFNLGNTYINKIASGGTPTEEEIKTLLHSGVDMAEVVKERFDYGLETPKNVALLANNPALFIGGSNPYMTLIRKKADLAVNALAEYDNPNAKLPSEEQISKVFSDVASFFEADPAIFMKACADNKSTNMEKLDAIFVARNAGIPMSSILEAHRNMKALEQSGKLKTLGYNKIKDLEDAINAKVDFPLDSYSKALMMLGASHMINHLGTNVDTALSCAENVFMREHVRIGNSYVPRTFISSGLKISNYDTRLLNELIQDDASAYAKAKGRKVGQYRYNHALQQIEVFDAESALEPMKTYDVKALGSLYSGVRAKKYEESQSWNEKPIKEVRAMKDYRDWGKL